MGWGLAVGLSPGWGAGAGPGRLGWTPRRRGPRPCLCQLTSRASVHSFTHSSLPSYSAVSKRLMSCAPEEDPPPLSGFRTVGETRLPSLSPLIPIRISFTTPSPFPEAPWHQPARTSVARLPSGDPWRGREAGLCEWAKTFFRGKPQSPLPIASRMHLRTRGPGRDTKPKRRMGGCRPKRVRNTGRPPSSGPTSQRRSTGIDGEARERGVPGGTVL